MTVRVLLVDDEAMVRVGLRMVLSAEPDLEVVGEAADGGQAVAAVAEHRPDVVLMDVRMPRVDGIEGARRVLAAAPEVKVLVLTTFDEDAYVEEALRAGVSGFLLKVAPPERLVEAVRTVAAGGGLLVEDLAGEVGTGHDGDPGRVDTGHLDDHLTHPQQGVQLDALGDAHNDGVCGTPPARLGHDGRARAGRGLPRRPCRRP